MEGPIIITSRQELTELIQRAFSVELKKIAEYLKISGEGKPPPENPNCLIETASKITGLAISTIRTKCHLGEMPYFKPPGTKKLQFNRAELIAWMESSKVKTMDEMEGETDRYLISKKIKIKKIRK